MYLSTSEIGLRRIPSKEASHSKLKQQLKTGTGFLRNCVTAQFFTERGSVKEGAAEKQQSSPYQGTGFLLLSGASTHIKV